MPSNATDTEAAMLVRRYYLDFVLAGAGLDDDGRARLSELNRQLSTLSTAFQQNLLQATEDAVVYLDSPDELDGLSPAAIATAADAATARGHDGKYAITLILPTGQPLLATLRNRDVRRRLFEASTNRANSGEHDNSPLVLEMTALRAERARLLGFASHADAKVADQTVKTSAAIDEFLSHLVAPAVANANAEAAFLADIATRDGVELAAWDWAFYSERVRAERYRHRHRSPATVFRPGAGAARRGVLRRGSAVRHRDGAADRSCRLPPRRPGVGGPQRRRHADRRCSSATSSPARASAAAPG